MKTIKLLQGIPASGKSTFAINLINSDESYKRINRDSLRSMINDYQFIDEKLIKSIRDDLIYKFLRRNYNVIVDDTNFHTIGEISEIAQNVGDVEIQVIYFPITLEEAIKRNSMRLGSSNIDNEVIERFYNKNIRSNKYLKNLTEITTIQTTYFQKQEYISINYNDCILVDLDGTLAIHNNRSAYDLKRVKEDSVNNSVKMIIDKFFKTKHIILLSGREDICRDDTIEWLEINNISYNELFMRKKGDMRKDSIVKKEIFEQEIRDKYNVLFCLDDRDQVVSMYRGLGLNCFAVNYGDF